ncbi:SulP family inorganic anion transporter [Zwartia vadi]|uniref:SulP family inorganic anion transporter n=1 Tax=Zwartia vadi TaxID=3058168 RepID=UPI0025B45E61|nr:sulfate permease [Zwartia vadi]MDN3987690.1 sulfate permease [Zwartia vadi]
MIALVEGYRAGLFARSQWWPNILAGLVVGIVALPLSMAFAIASGARPEQGIYTAIIGGGLVTLLGGSRLQISGPTGAFIVILAGITAKYGIAGLQIATLMAGLILLVMGLAKMGGLIKFIPTPVIIGFTTGIGVIIFVGQWAYFLGLPKPEGEHFHEKVWSLLQSLGQTHWPTFLIALLSLVIVVFSNKIKIFKRIPGPLLAMVVATILQALLQLPGVATIGTMFGGVPQGLPAFAWPDMTVSNVLSLVGPAFTIAMLGAIESLLSAVVADRMAGTRHNSNQELIGQGVANIVTPLFGGFAATGAIARTATNIRNGGTGPLAGIVHVLTLVLILLVLAPLASSIPLAALAAILFVVAWNMSELHNFGRLLLRAPTADRVVLVVTFLLTVFVDLVVAVNIGVMLAIFHFLRRMAASVETREVGEDVLKRPDGVMVYEIDGPMFFAAIESFERALKHTATDPETLVIRLRRVPFIDATGLQSIEEVVTDLHRRGVQVLLCEANPRVLEKMRKSKLVDERSSVQYCDTIEQAFEHARLATEAT